MGILAAAAKNPITNSALRFISYLGLAMPNFLLALMIMLTSTVLFGDSLTGLFSKEFRDAPWSYDRVMDFLSHAWLPVFILGWSATAFALQTVRALMSDEIGKLYVTAAAARGISGRQLLWRYPARHALSPIVNSLGFDLNRIFNELLPGSTSLSPKSAVRCIICKTKLPIFPIRTTARRRNLHSDSSSERVIVNASYFEKLTRHSHVLTRVVMVIATKRERKSVCSDLRRDPLPR